MDVVFGPKEDRPHAQVAPIHATKCSLHLRQFLVAADHVPT